MSAILLYGPAGSGKTTFAASFCNLGYRVHFIDCDRKVRTMRNLQGHLQSGRVTVTEIESPVVEETLAEIARGGIGRKPKTEPRGFYEICDIIEAHREEPLENAERTVLVLDSLTRVNQHLKALVRFQSKDGIIAQPGWGAILITYESLFDTFTHLQPEPYAHVVVICHSLDERDEALQQILSRPLIDGSFKNSAGSYVDEMFFCVAKAANPNAPAQFLAYTRPTGSVMQARTSRDDLPTTIIQDMAEVFDPLPEPPKKRAETKKGGGRA